MFEDNSNLQWYAVRVRSNAEKAVQSAFQYKGFDTFLPTYRDRRTWSDRIKELELPLFPGYLFCRLNPEKRLPLLITPGVVNLVGIGKTPAPIADEEILRVKTIVESDLPSRPWPFLHVGQTVQVKTGPLAGVEGILQEFKSGYRIIVSITLLQRSIATEMDGAWVRPLTDSHSITTDTYPWLKRSA